MCGPFWDNVAADGGLHSFHALMIKCICYFT